MQVLMISTDRKILEENSSVQKRMSAYGSLVDELHIIVFSNLSTTNPIRIGENVFVYSTNSKSKWFYVFDAIKIGKKILRDKSLNTLITCQDPFETGLVGWHLSKKFRTPFQLQVHTDFLSPYFSKGGLLNFARKKIALFLMPKANCVRVVSERIKGSIEKYFPEKKLNIFVLPIFVDKDSFFWQKPQFDLHERYPQFEKIILMVSRLTEEKDIQKALRVFKKIVKKHPKTGLVIVGDGPLVKKLKNLAKRYQLEKNVFFEGWKDDINSYFKTADIFLLTSLYEGYGLVLMQAALSGVPIVTTDVGLVGEDINKENALVCPVNDIDCLLDNISLLIENPELRKDMSQKLQNKVAGNIISKDKYLQRMREGWNVCLKK